MRIIVPFPAGGGYDFNATLKALQAADFKERAAALGVELIGSSPEELAKHQRAEIARWTKIGRAANIKVD